MPDHDVANGKTVNGHYENGKTDSKIHGFKNGYHEDVVVDITDDDKVMTGLKQADLNPHKNNKSTKPQMPERVSFFTLFRFADALDIIMMVIGFVCMLSLGAAIPVNLSIFGNVLTKFIGYDMQRRSGVQANQNQTSWTTAADVPQSCMKRMNVTSTVTIDELRSTINNTYVPAFCGIGVTSFILAYSGMAIWVWTGHRQVRKIRIKFFEAVMRQGIGWFDVHDSAMLNSRMVEDMERLNEAFGDKMATFIQWIATFIGGYAIGFATGWKLTLVTISVAPLLVAVTAILGRFMRTLVQRELNAYAKAGSVADETFSCIRTVAAFGGEKIAEERYAFNLIGAYRQGLKKGVVGGTTVGIFWIIIFGIFALAFWYGAKLTRDEDLPPGAILTVFFGVMLGSMSLGHAAPVLENFNNARGAAAAIFKVIDAKIEIDSASEHGLKPEKLQGNVEFDNVGFTYPSRKEVKILKGLSLSIKKGETVALVGESGCGKSTTIQLLQRFYDCETGKISVDGKDLREYNLTWLRNYMGIVSQEPVLFATTILDNIKLGGKYGVEVTEADVERAAKEANCYDFISKLPDGFHTLVGERGVQLSGGQKQRIAIARALVRNPSILLLDEATSALDTQSEAIVQETLDKASQGRTTIIIAHRLSTVKNADKIVALKDGKVYEQGTHNELMAKQGLYYGLWMQQIKRETEEKDKLQEEKPDSSLLTQPKDTSNSLSPKLKRSSSLRRSARSGSIRSIRSVTATAKDALNFGVELNQTQMVDEEYTSDDEKSFEKDKKEPVLPADYNMSIFELISLNKPEWPLMLLGLLGSIMNGFIQPAFTLVMSNIIRALSECDHEKQSSLVASFCGYIMLVGGGALIASLLQSLCFSLSGEKLTMRLRKQAFASLLHQPISFFDDKNNGVGLLTSRLSVEAAHVKAATGSMIGILASSGTTIAVSLAIALYFLWELALVMMLVLPMMLIVGKVQARITTGHSVKDKESIEQGGKMAQEAIMNMRTVTSLNRQRYFVERFNENFKLIHKEDAGRTLVYGLAYGVSSCTVFFMYALCFGFGGYLLVCDCLPWRSEPFPFFYIFQVFASITFGGMAAGRSMAQLGDITKAKLAAFNIKKLINMKSEIDPTSSEGEFPDKCEGVVSFSDVEFVYPARKTVPVLQGLTFTINKGETLALVGASGCGKSTSVSLLERFYDPRDGIVSLDGRKVQSLNIKWLRQKLGLVSQEPVLFDSSIKDNIAYGDNTRNVGMDEIIHAAKQANAHNFITTLPQGYETNVGSRGTQLSGGQKQRIAIARALVRNPAVLLLDEATSALDTESEKIVQQALDEAIKGRTCIIIAHRLSTIKNSTKIAVIASGKIVEMGTHEELLAKKNAYFNLVNAQL